MPNYSSKFMNIPSVTFDGLKQFYIVGPMRNAEKHVQCLS